MGTQIRARLASRKARPLDRVVRIWVRAALASVICSTAVLTTAGAPSSSGSVLPARVTSSRLANLQQLKESSGLLLGEEAPVRTGAGAVPARTSPSSATGGSGRIYVAPATGYGPSQAVTQMAHLLRKMGVGVGVLLGEEALLRSS
jgi:hypothetical protein